MFSFFTKKKLKVPTSNELKQVDAIKLWIVAWYSRHGQFSSDTTKEYEAFTSEEAATEFAESLKNAYALLRHTSGTRIDVYTKEIDPV